MEGKIRSWLWVVVTVTTWVMIVEQSWGAADISFNLETAQTGSYTNLMQSVRDKVKDPTLHYGGTTLPVQAAPTTPTRYLYIDLKANSGTITVALSKNDLYVVGYLDNVNGVKKAHFLKDAEKTAFPEVTIPANRITMGFGGSYLELERAAHISRKDLGLGRNALKKYIDQLYKDKKLDGESEARLMLIVIQMIAEAARFKYIQYNIGKTFPNDAYKPDNKALVLEKNWAVTTKAIKDGNKAQKPFLTIKDKDFQEVTWQTFDDLVKDMGLLKYEGRSLLHPFFFYYHQMLAYFFGDSYYNYNRNDGGGLSF